MKKAIDFVQDKVGHYPVLFIGAVVASVKWKWRHMDNVDDIMVTAWATFLQTIFTASKKGLEEATEASYNKALSDVDSLAGS